MVTIKNKKNNINQNSKIMVILYIWYPSIMDLQVGHTSLDINGEEYVSFWPSDDNSNVKRKKVEVALSSRQWTYSDSYDEDIAEEGSPAHITIKIRGLNEKEMMKWWGKFHEKTESKRFHLFHSNCSTVVAQCLHHGFDTRKGGFWDKASDTARYITSIAGWLKLISNASVWTPVQVEEFALSLKNVIDDYEN